MLVVWFLRFVGGEWFSLGYWSERGRSQAWCFWVTLGFHAASVLFCIFGEKLSTFSFLPLTTNIINIIRTLLNWWFAFPLHSDLTDFLLECVHFLSNLFELTKHVYSNCASSDAYRSISLIHFLINWSTLVAELILFYLILLHLFILY